MRIHLTSRANPLAIGFLEIFGKAGRFFVPEKPKSIPRVSGKILENSTHSDNT